MLTLFLLARIQFLAVAIIAYFCGCFNGSVIVSKYILRDDIRNHGSGNAGLTNFYRTFGGPLTVVVILCDMLKAVVAVQIGVWLSGYYQPGFGVDAAQPDPAEMVILFKYWAGLFCMLGHMFPCMFHFKGGKGILSGGAIAILIDWRIAVVVWGGFFLLAVLTRYVSLGSCVAGALFPVATWLVYRNMTVTSLGIVIGGLILYMHRGNIKRLLAGTENKFSLHRKN
ncbi:MAG: glycerol-3-phosphate acyltransferase [Lawsonibacter sp.]